MKTNFKTTLKDLCINSGKRNVNSLSLAFFHKVSLPPELQKLQKKTSKEH